MTFGRYPLQRMHAPIRKAESRASDEVFYGAGDTNLARARRRRHPRADVDRDPADLIANDFTLSSVKPSPDLDREWAERIATGTRAPHGTRWGIEHGEEAITRGVNFTPAETGQFLAHDRVIPLEYAPPLVIAQLRGHFGRPNDVGKEDCCQNPVQLEILPGTGKELRGFVENRVLVARPDEVIDALQLDQLRSRDAFDEVMGLLDLHEPVACPMQDQRGNPDRGQDVARVDLARHS